jgi:hypothetical protein
MYSNGHKNILFKVSISTQFHVIHTSSGGHTVSYPMGTGGSFPGVKQLSREADNSPQTSAKVKKIWIYTFTPPYASLA